MLALLNFRDGLGAVKFVVDLMSYFLLLLPEMKN